VSEIGIMGMVRKIVSFVVLIAAGLALIGFFIGSSALVFDPFKAAFDPFNFEKFGLAIYTFIEVLSFPLIMIILGIIGLTI